MSISKDDYSKMTDKASPNSPKVLNCIKAFLIGGTICLIGQILFMIFEKAGLNEKEVSAATSSVLIIITAVLPVSAFLIKLQDTQVREQLCRLQALQTALYPLRLNGSMRLCAWYRSANVFNRRSCHSLRHSVSIFIRLEWLTLDFFNF